MSIFIRYVLISFFLFFSNLAFAQCPYGIPNAPGCVPPDAWPQNQGRQPIQRQPHWVYTWGAMAKDSEGPVGVSTGHDSKRRAEKAAIRDCLDRGGSKCEILISYHHQCMAAAYGRNFSWAHGPDLEETEHEALKACNGSDGEGRCDIFYSNCTEPYISN